MEKVASSHEEKTHLSSTLIASSCATVGMSTIGGALIGGISGALTGLTTSIFDEVLISKNKTEKHYLTQSSFWSFATFLPAASLISKFLDIENTVSSVVLQGAALASSIALPHLIDDFLDYRERLEFPIRSFQAINQFFDREGVCSLKELYQIKDSFKESYLKGLERAQSTFNALYNNVFITTMASNTSIGLLQTIVKEITAWYLAKHAGGLFISNLLGEKPKTAQDIFYKSMSVLGLYLFHATVNCIIEKKRYAFFCDVYKEVVPAYAEIFLEKENASKILEEKEGSEILTQMPNHFFSVLDQGVYSLNPIIFDSALALTAIRNLMKISPDALAPYTISLILSHNILKGLVKEGNQTASKHAEVEQAAWMKRWDIMSNLARINLRDAGSFAHEKFCGPLVEEHRLDVKSRQLRVKESYFKDLKRIFNNAIDGLYIGAKFLYGQIEAEEVFNLKKALDNMTKFFLSSLNYQFDRKRLAVSLGKINHFFEMINKAQNSSVERSTNDLGKIIFKDYELFLGDQRLISIDNFEFEKGSRYALTGPSGCGKSSLLADLKIGLFGNLTSHGKISVGSNGATSSMMFIDQNLYLPRGSTLLELAYFPKVIKGLDEKETETLKERVLQLFDELNIDKFTNGDEVEESLSSRIMSKDFKLSGGQSKKLAVIQAIISQPSILIMDETFTGLDKNSMISVQSALQRYLPSTLMISVDHHPDDNNNNNFYNKLINFSEGGLQEVPLA
ncbi:MAG: hypothetical protein S4CHLAM6_16230 [Chlamydiae bacterium]|nr:hypothetical protein [Chlamydiota bacterium]